MASLELLVLGCNSAKPTRERYPSAQVLKTHTHYFLFDCGEGAQFRMRTMKVNFMKIDYIFISHMHGDHVFGLIGLLSSMSLLNRTTPLTIFADPDLKKLLAPHISYFCRDMPFELNFVPLAFDLPKIILKIKGYIVQSVPLRHRVRTCGFVLRETPKERNIRESAICRYGLNFAEIAAVKSGKPYYDPQTGDRVPEAELLMPPKIPRSFAYISDTAYKPDIVPFISGVTLLYHEATFAEEHAEMAPKTYHSTARQAAEIAKMAGVGKLLIGHYSSRYTETDTLEAEAKQVFADTTAVYDGFTINF